MKRKKIYKENEIYRKEVEITGGAINRLQKLADQSKRDLKPQMELILEEEAKRVNNLK